MKSLKSVTILALAAILIAGVGCKKTPKNTTFIPKVGGSGPTDDPTSRGPLTGQTGQPINRGAPLTNGANPNANNLPGDGSTATNLDPNTVGNPGTRPPEGTPEDASILAAETVYFDYDRSSVKNSEVAKVQRVATYLKNTSGAMLRVEGNCDERGTEEYNRSLGERRALAVRELLIASGIAPERVTTTTYGEDKPVDQGHDESAWSKNRRADFIVLNPVATGVQ